MKTILKLIIGLLISGCTVYAAGENDIQYLNNRLSSKWWQVRYCLINKLNERNDPDQHLIKKLINDDNETVSLYAHQIYMLHYLFIEKDLIIKKITKLVPPPLGDKSIGSEKDYEQSIKTVSHYASLLKKEDINNPKNAVPIQFIGILGKPEDIGLIKPFVESKNDYVLLECAKALFRIGDNESGIKIIVKILAKDVKDHIFYQTEALYVLYKIDTKKFKDEYIKLRQKVENSENIQNIQPNWLNYHFMQGMELSK